MESLQQKVYIYVTWDRETVTEVVKPKTSQGEGKFMIFKAYNHQLPLSGIGKRCKKLWRAVQEVSHDGWYPYYPELSYIELSSDAKNISFAYYTDEQACCWFKLADKNKFLMDLHIEQYQDKINHYNSNREINSEYLPNTVDELEAFISDRPKMVYFYGENHSTKVTNIYTGYHDYYWIENLNIENLKI